MTDATTAQIAFPDNPLRLIVKDVAVRASIYTEPASRTALLIDHHFSVGHFRYGVHWTKVCADWIVTLETHHWNEIDMQFLADPSGPDGHDLAPLGLGIKTEAMFLPASHLTGMATDAVVNIYQQDFL